MIIFAFASTGIVWESYAFGGGFFADIWGGNWWVVLGSLALVAFSSYYALDMGAALIAPAAENHAIRKRLAGLAIMAGLLVALFFTTEHEVIITILGVIATVVCLDAITETPNLLPSIIAPFAKAGVPGRIAGCFFAPGWHTGVLYLLLVIGGASFCVYEAVPTSTWHSDGDAIRFIVGLIGAIVFPLALIQLIFPRAPKVFAVYLLVQCSVMLYVMLVTIMASVIRHNEIYYFASFLPVVLLTNPDDTGDLGGPFLIVALISTAASLVILTVRSIPIFRKAREIRRKLTASPVRSEPPSETEPEAAP